MHPLRALFLCWILIGASIAIAAPQQPSKLTELVPMRDGISLSTDIYLPKGTGPFPVVVMRTPYNKAPLASQATEANQRGFALVVQDTRGRNASPGLNLPYYSDGPDGFDTLEWMASQPWCNGKIGTLGTSALSNAHYLLMASGSKRISSEHHTVGSPGLYHDVIFPGGVFKKFLIEEWLSSQRYSPASLQNWTQQAVYSDYWAPMDARRHFGHANAPAMHIGGWHDIFAQATLDAFQGYNQKGQAKARGTQKLIMGPWTHSIYTDQVGALKYRNAKSPPNGVQDPWAWFEWTLMNKTTSLTTAPAVTYYVMGDAFDPQAPGNEWRTADRWPPRPYRKTAFYFHDNGILRGAKPDANRPRSFLYDPANPVPTIGGTQNPPPNGPMIQNSIEDRSDLLLFTSEPLTEPMEITGKVDAVLYISSDCPDTDFFVRLCDVYPDGRSFNICEGQIRARFRNGLDQEKLLKPGEVVTLKVDLWSTSIVMNRGHSLRVHVTSSSAPGFDPNPNTGAPFRANALTRVARNTLYLDTKRPSHLLLPVVSK